MQVRWGVNSMQINWTPYRVDAIDISVGSGTRPRRRHPSTRQTRVG